MKNEFPGFDKKKSDEMNEIWTNAIICFDANVLLNLYRYSLTTRNELLDLIEKFKKRIWLPHQVALEYNRNRYEVIADQEKTYENFINNISQIENDLKSTNKPPFLSEKLQGKLQKIFGDVKAEVNDSIKHFQTFLHKDPLYDIISTLFIDKISKGFSSEELKEIFLEGEKRYSNKIPPGYEDAKTKDEIKKFGDLILWKQIIEKAKKEKKPILLITDERKSDWWWKLKDGRNMGPRQELVEELKTLAGVDFHMYSSERFLSYGNKFLKQQINQKAIDEITEVKKSDIDNINKEKRDILIRNNYVFENKKKKELTLYNLKYDQVNNEINMLSKHIELLDKKELNDEALSKYLNDKMIYLNELMKEKEMLKYNLHRLDRKSNSSNFWFKQLRDFDSKNFPNDSENN